MPLNILNYNMRTTFFFKCFHVLLTSELLCLMHTRSGNQGVTHRGLPARRVWGTPASGSRKLSQNFCAVLGAYVSGPPSPGPGVSQSVVLTCSAHFSLDTASGPSTSFHKKATQTKHPKPFGRDSVVIRVHTGKRAT